MVSEQQVKVVHPDYPTPIPQLNLLYEEHAQRVYDEFTSDYRPFTDREQHLAMRMFNDDRKVGDAGWVNASASTRREYCQKAREELHNRRIAEQSSDEALAITGNSSEPSEIAAVIARLTGLPGVGLVIMERLRQVDTEGYTVDSDQYQREDALATAAACYLTPHSRRALCVGSDGSSTYRVPTGWPWQAWSWKPSPDNRLRELLKGAALAIAEVDRYVKKHGVM